jgi:hypothetical protein
MPKVLAVIHHVEDAVSLRNAAVAAGAGCDGVVMIQMEGRDWELDGPSAAIKAAHPGLLVVANRLSCRADEAIARDSELGLDGSWTDDAGVTSRGAAPWVGRIRGALSAARDRNPGFLFFGSVAFKGQEPEPDPSEAARNAARESWIVTTSGPGTGHAPGEGKLMAMAVAAGRDRLAVASGITPANASVLARHVGWVLVATGISRSFHELDADLTADLVATCRRLDA